MKITNNSGHVEGFHTETGLVQIKPGETRDVALTGAGLELAKRLPYLGIEGVDRGTAMQKAPTAPLAPPVAPVFSVADKGRGWFVITADGVEVTKSLRKDDVEGFDEFSEGEKAQFIKANKADD